MSDTLEESFRSGRLSIPDELSKLVVHIAKTENRWEPPHPFGFGNGPADRTCEGCAWNSGDRCIQTRIPGKAAKKLFPHWRACARWEEKLVDSDCLRCGACCREGYSLAPVKRGEAMAKAHPEWVRPSPLGAHLPRPAGKCVALCGDGTAERPWKCLDYAVRPRACSELEVGSLACLTARRRVGISR